jgi:hypothetical protein
MSIIGFTLVGVAIFFAIVLATILFGAAARGAKTEALKRTERERRAGLTGDVTQTPDSIHDRFVQT